MCEFIDTDLEANEKPLMSSLSVMMFDMMLKITCIKKMLQRY